MKQKREVLNTYLEQVEHYLKQMPALERVDIIKEIKSEMMELTSAGMSEEEAAARLGNPKELAMAYLGEAIGKSSSFSLQKLGAVFAFYSLAGLGSVFVLPFISILSVGLMAGGILGIIGGAIKSLAFLAGIDVPWVVMQIGSYQVPPLLSFPVALIMGSLLFLAGKGLWKLTLHSIRLLGRLDRSRHANVSGL